jgi:hypothetical protein
MPGLRDLRAFITKVIAGPKEPMIRAAVLLGVPEEILARMRSSSDENCEELLLRHIENGHGCVADWRERVSHVLYGIGPFLTTEESDALRDADEAGDPGFPKAVHLLDARLRPPMRALRAIGGLGDNYIVFLAPREGLAEFDEKMRPWLV